MGRMKDFLHDMQGKKNPSENKNWITIKQNEIVRYQSGKDALIYNDLINLDEIKDDNIEMRIILINNSEINIKAKHIIEVNSVCLTYERNYEAYDGKVKQYIVRIPMNKILMTMTIKKFNK